MSRTQNSSVSGALAFDAQNLDQLRLQAKRDPKAAIGAAAKQFESVFLNMVLKSMREATPQDGMFDSEQTRLYTSLLDQQLAQHLANRGTGLSEVMARQLSNGLTDGVTPEPLSAADPATLPLNLSLLAPTPARGMPVVPENREPAAELPALPDIPKVTAPPSAAASATPLPIANTRDFVNRVWSHAVEAARSIGVKPQFMVGQAALESGWGKHEIRAADGSQTYNLFGVKAGRGWNGPVVEKTTTEYVNGVAQKTTAKFRVYESYAEAFRDYANLLQNNPRYSSVVGQAQDARGFASGLQRAGYATDPAYADKLVRVINGPTMRLSMQNEPRPQMVARRG
jgi:flagellar protein FlgJ